MVAVWFYCWFWKTSSLSPSFIMVNGKKRVRWNKLQWDFACFSCSFIKKKKSRTNESIKWSFKSISASTGIYPIRLLLKILHQHDHKARLPSSCQGRAFFQLETQLIKPGRRNVSDFFFFFFFPSQPETFWSLLVSRSWTSARSSHRSKVYHHDSAGSATFTFWVVFTSPRSFRQ